MFTGTASWTFIPRRRPGIRPLLAALIALGAAGAQDTAELRLRTATTHPMQFYVSLPKGWSAARTWPVVVVVESARREFQANLTDFVRARGDMPFILVAPLVVTNGGVSGRISPPYPYSAGVWKEVDQAGDFRFDSQGLAAVMADIAKLYRGEVKYFLTGWEAGGHTVWAMIFQHPEAMRAAAPVTPNYQGRWMDAGNFSTDGSRVSLPVKVFQAGVGPEPWPNPYFVKQNQEAMRVAADHGYRNVSRVVVAGKPHGALAEEVLGYFNSLLAP